MYIQLHVQNSAFEQTCIAIDFVCLCHCIQNLTSIHLSLTPADQQQQLFEADTKPLIESGFCDSIVSFGEFIDLDPDLEEDGEEDIPPLVESGITLGPLVKYSYAVPNIVEYIQQIDTETDNVSST